MSNPEKITDNDINRFTQAKRDLLNKQVKKYEQRKFKVIHINDFCAELRKKRFFSKEEKVKILVKDREKSDKKRKFDVIILKK